MQGIHPSFQMLEQGLNWVKPGAVIRESETNEPTAPPSFSLQVMGMTPIIYHLTFMPRGIVPYDNHGSFVCIYRNQLPEKSGSLNGIGLFVFGVKDLFFAATFTGIHDEPIRSLFPPQGITDGLTALGKSRCLCGSAYPPGLIHEQKDHPGVITELFDQPIASFFLTHIGDLARLSKLWPADNSSQLCVIDCGWSPNRLAFPIPSVPAPVGASLESKRYFENHVFEEACAPTRPSVGEIPGLVSPVDRVSAWRVTHSSLPSDTRGLSAGPFQDVTPPMGLPGIPAFLDPDIVKSRRAEPRYRSWNATTASLSCAPPL